jgi:transcriptional antiterminator RfaH
MSNFVAGWYLIYTKPKHERKVAAGLAGLGLNFFMPLTRNLRTWHDRKKYLEMPLFPSYVFVYLKNGLEYKSSVDMDGVLYFVRSGKEVVRVPDKIIADLQTVISGGGEMEVTYEHYQTGRQLYISQGPLSGLSCEVVEYRGKKGIIVRVNLLQRNVILALPPEYLLTA